MSERYIGQPLEERLEELEKKLERSYTCPFDCEKAISELEQKFDQEIEIRRSRWQFLKSTVNSALLPYLVPINKRLGYNPKTDKYERIEELEKEVENKYNQLLWIKMIPYREWFWNLKNTTDKQITSLKDNVDSNRGQINANLDGINYCRKFMFNLEIVLQDHLKSHIDVARDQLTDKDKLTIFREFDEAIQKQLEKLDSNIKVTISRNDGEKGKNSKEVISSNENNLSTPERRKDGEKEPTLSMKCPDCGNILKRSGAKGYFICRSCEYKKDGEKEVEEMSNKNLCREESNIDILPPSKPSIHYAADCNTIDCRICNPKEPTEKEDHEFDYDYNCVKCGKNLLELVDRTYLTTEFDTHNTHKIVQKADLEEWRDELKNKYSKSNVIKQIEKYLEERIKK